MNKHVHKFADFVRKHTFSSGKDVQLVYFNFDRDELFDELKAYELEQTKVLRYSIIVRMSFDKWLLFKEKGMEAIRKHHLVDVHNPSPFTYADISKAHVTPLSFDGTYAIKPVQQILFYDLRKESHPVVHMLKES